MNEPFTLLLRLEGPMQSWGYRSRFDYRDTALEPTRSGVIGLICAAMGIARGEPISQFDPIRMGVRVDKDGRPERDYHTALDVIKADGTKGGTVVSYRDYLSDASLLSACNLKTRISSRRLPKRCVTRPGLCFWGARLSVCRPAPRTGRCPKRKRPWLPVFRRFKPDVLLWKLLTEKEPNTTRLFALASAISNRDLSEVISRDRRCEMMTASIGPLYLSRLLLNPHSRQVMGEIAHPYEMHRTLMRAFPESGRSTVQSTGGIRCSFVPTWTTSGE